jgi:hypothetical protein
MRTTQDTINECKEKLREITDDINYPGRDILIDSYTKVIEELQRVEHIIEDLKIKRENKEL